MERLERVKLEGCRCPGGPHRDGDWVDLARKASVPMGTAVMAAFRGGGRNRFLMEGYLADAYLNFGIRAWSFTDEDGEEVPVDPAAPDWKDILEQWLPWAEGGSEVIDRADTLYSEDVLRPLLSRTSTSSQGGQMDGSTSATPDTGLKPQKPSTRSSRTSSEDGKPSEDPGQ